MLNQLNGHRKYTLYTKHPRNEVNYVKRLRNVHADIYFLRFEALYGTINED